MTTSTVTAAAARLKTLGSREADLAGGAQLQHLGQPCHHDASGFTTSNNRFPCEVGHGIDPCVA
jgi:hypothetical protein